MANGKNALNVPSLACSLMLISLTLLKKSAANFFNPVILLEWKMLAFTILYRKLEVAGWLTTIRKLRYLTEGLLSGFLVNNLLCFGKIPQINAAINKWSQRIP